MQLVDRYVDAVRSELPRTLRAGVGRELAALLAESVEARIAAGLAPRAAQLDVLREMGHPREVAMRYAGRRRALLDHELLPALWTTLGLVVAVLVALNLLAWVWQARGDARPLAALIAALPAAGTQLVSSMLEVVGLVLLIFIAVEWLELRGRRAPAAWDPAVLEAAPAPGDRVNRWSALAGTAALTFLTIFALFFLDDLRAGVSAGEGGLARVPLAGPGLTSAAHLLATAFAASMIAQAALLARGRWSPSLRLFDLGARILGALVLGLVLAMPEPLLAIEARDAVAAGLEPDVAARLAGELSPLLDRLARVGLALGLAGATFGVVRRLWRLTRRGRSLAGTVATG